MTIKCKIMQIKQRINMILMAIVVHEFLDEYSYVHNVFIS